MTRGSPGQRALIACGVVASLTGMGLAVADGLYGIACVPAGNLLFAVAIYFRDQRPAPAWLGGHQGHRP